MALQVFLLSYNAMPFIYILRACFAHHRNCRHCRQLVVFARGRLILSGKKVLAKNWQQVGELRFTKRLFLVVKNDIFKKVRPPLKDDQFWSGTTALKQQDFDRLLAVSYMFLIHLPI